MKNSVLLLFLVGCSFVKEEIFLGTEWSKVATAGFSARRNFGTAVIDDEIIIIAGTTSNILVNDVWISKDKGRSWEEIKTHSETPTDTFPKRQSFGTVVIDKDIYIIGGYGDGGTPLNDVWKSSDKGATWTEITGSANFDPRYGHQAVAIGNTIYIIGGYDGEKYFNEVLKSDDFGLSWRNITSLPYARTGSGAIEYDNEILLIGGNNGTPLTDLWRTEEQYYWYKQPNVPFEYFEAGLVSVKNDIFVVVDNHVWKSIDGGISWTKILFDVPFGRRTGFALVNIDRELILIGGQETYSGTYKNDIWVSKY